MRFLFSFLMAVFCFLPVSPALAAQTWQQVGEHIHQATAAAMELYAAGDVAGAKKGINDVYYAIYEKDGLEMAVRNTVAAKNANMTEYQFNKLKKAMTDGKSVQEVQAEADKVLEMIDFDIGILSRNGGPSGGWASFWPAFIILLREGVEAILVLVAIIAYLGRAGHEKYLSTVYNWAIAGIVASFITAYICSVLLESAETGASRETIEGFTALTAVVVLLSTSAWMGSKAQGDAWKKYIEGMVGSTISTGKLRALGFAAFLAVYREGAEVVLFYQALFNNASGDIEMIWLGFAAGCAVLAILFFLMQTGALRIPLRPFFLGTSLLMFLLAVSFTGGGIEALQEAEMVSMTLVEGIPVPTIDLLGIYPTYETLVPQLALILAAVIAVFYKRQSGKASAA